jgi:cytochrome c553
MSIPPLADRRPGESARAPHRRPFVTLQSQFRSGEPSPKSRLSQTIAAKEIPMNNLPRLIAITTLVLPLVSSARTSSAAPENVAPPAPPAAAPEKAAGPPKPWKDMTKAERGKYMKDVVTPQMRPVFQAYDAELFAKFDCSTCHGKDPKGHKFKMPSPDLHALPNTPELFMAALKAKPSWPKWSKFMSEKVEPQVAALLGKPAFDPKKPDPGAFSCNGCHTLSADAGKTAN